MATVYRQSLFHHVSDNRDFVLRLRTVMTNSGMGMTNCPQAMTNLQLPMNSGQRHD